MVSITKDLMLIKNKVADFLEESLSNPNALILNNIAFYFNDREQPFSVKFEQTYAKAIIGKSAQEIDQEKTEKKFNKLIAEYIRTNKIINSKFTKDLMDNPIVKFYASLRTLKDSRYNNLLKRINLFDPKDRILNLTYGLHYRKVDQKSLQYYFGVYDPQKKEKISATNVKLFTNRILFIALFNAHIKPILPTIFKYCTAGYLENNEYKLDEVNDLKINTDPFISYHSLIDFILSSIDYEFNILERHISEDEYERYIEVVTDNEIKILNYLKDHITCSQTINRIDNILIKKYLVKKDLEHAKEIFNKNYKEDQNTVSDLCSSLLIAYVENNFSQMEKIFKEKLVFLKNLTVEEIFALHPIVSLLPKIKDKINFENTDINAFSITLNLYSVYKYGSIITIIDAHHSYYLSTILSKDEIENICTQQTFDEAQEHLTALINSDKHSSMGLMCISIFVNWLATYNKCYEDNIFLYSLSEGYYSLYNFVSEFVYPYAKTNILNPESLDSFKEIQDISSKLLDIYDDPDNEFYVLSDKLKQDIIKNMD